MPRPYRLNADYDPIEAQAERDEQEARDAQEASESFMFQGQFIEPDDDGVDL